MYDNFVPDEAGLRAAHAALELEVPVEIEHQDQGRRLAALSAHLQRAMTRATYNLVDCYGPDAAAAARRASAVMPLGWPVEEDQWQAARIELTFTKSRFTRLIDTGPAPDAPDGSLPWTDEREGHVVMEAHAAGAEAALDLATDLIDLRLNPGNSHLVRAALHTMAEHLDTLAGIRRVLLEHHDGNPTTP
ncbi:MULTISPECIES: hypothetical protein [unclassified Kitasatospora]|uniref:hypothetical protein n=1 Tax=unclassified Kitasatospora TaxID=2633591 RepID=UPI0012F9B7E4|nr:MULTISPECIES: hypothetical protein [unclassified Kitasatospora]